MKYLLLKKIPRLYFKEYQGRNKPIWTDNHLEAAQYDREYALRMQKRLACQSQIVSLIEVNKKKNDFIERAWNEETH